MNQMDWVCGQVIKKGRVSRAAALERGITRLPSYINRIKKRGFKFVRIDDGKDVVYLVK